MEKDTQQRNHEVVSLVPFPLDILFLRRDVIKNWNLTTTDLKMPYWRIYRPYNSYGFIHYNDQVINLKAGSVYLIAPNTPFVSRTRGGLLEKLYAHFTLGGPYADCMDFIQELPDNPPLLDMLEQMSESLLERKYDDRLILLTTAAINLAVSLLPPEHLEQHRNIEFQLLSVYHMIKKNPAQNYSNKKLASIAHMSLCTFIKKFYNSFGVTPQHFLLEQKVDMAALLLLQSDETISDIAESCGFCNRYYFTRIFTKYRGISPAAFRKTDHL